MTRNEHWQSVILEATNYKQSHIFRNEMVASYCMQLIAVANAICLQNGMGFFLNILHGDTFCG